MTMRSANAPPGRLLHRVVAHGLNTQATQGWIAAGAIRIRCAFGRSGRRAFKREGDGATPRGNFRLLALRFRADRIVRPRTLLPANRLRPDALWCDDPASGLYNRPARAPLKAGHERMWRDDGLYDIVIMLDHNQRPRVKRAGSAIFFHCARPGYAPTEGCVAIAAADMRRLLPRLGRDVAIRVF